MSRIKYCDTSVNPPVWRYADTVPNTQLPVVNASPPSDPVEGQLWVDLSSNTVDVPNGNELGY